MRKAIVPIVWAALFIAIGVWMLSPEAIYKDAEKWRKFAAKYNCEVLGQVDEKTLYVCDTWRMR